MCFYLEAKNVVRAAHSKVCAFSERGLYKQLEIPLLDWFLAGLAFGPGGFGELKQKMSNIEYMTMM